VDKSGTVVRARVIEGLGHGLDEAALAAAKAAKFQAALECGKPVESTFVISVRFAM
jgi:protein TonB